ncbi:MAG: SUMF1/EgtB/PvdO family nonheme iron enzyme [Ardenticatenia bacterium]|nr:SUMF1/EgtB/PvdO family nonheme iron enzyme [Ardenticatenia bacterium]
MAEDWYALFRRRITMDPPDLEAHLAQMYPGGRLTAPRFWQDPAFNNPAQPVVGISWFEARAYTLWLAAQTGEPYRLPTELEWEAAARGAGGQPFADDDASEACGANTSELHVWRPSPMGVFPAGDTPEGVMDLCGNVWEWTSSVFGAEVDLPLYEVPRLPGTEATAEDPGASPQLRRVRAAAPGTARGRWRWPGCGTRCCRAEGCGVWDAGGVGLNGWGSAANGCCRLR